MKLTKEEQEIYDGQKGETLAKIMRTVVEFGDIFGAKRLIPTTHGSHFVTSFGLGLLKPIYKINEEIISAGIKTKEPFTMDPRPIDYKNVKCGLLNKFIFSKIMYSKQKYYEEQLKMLGLKDNDSFTCTSYLPEVGNTPKEGDILGWAESSAVVYANSVLGARCNRNSGVLDLFYAILGKVPEYGLLTNEGRKADYIVEINTTKLPEAQILGSAIGMKVMEDVPYVTGLEKFLGTKLDEEVKAYLKDFGAATASNGSVGLFHIENLTPEAVKLGRTLIKDNPKKYVITDKTLEEVYKSYPILWKNKNAKPKICFIGCPHLTLSQLNDWAEKIVFNLEKNNLKKIKVRTILTTSPQIAKIFEKTENYKKLIATGVKISSICPLMYTNNPLAGKKEIITSSNKLRTYSSSRYFKDADILKIITGGNTDENI